MSFNASSIEPSNAVMQAAFMAGSAWRVVATCRRGTAPLLQPAAHS